MRISTEFEKMREIEVRPDFRVRISIELRRLRKIDLVFI